MPLPLVGAAVAGAAGLAGGIIRNKQQRKEAQKNRDFQERMSGSAYQRAVKDMKLAGINPMLAYMQGGASSPGGAQASMEDVAGPAVSSAMHARRLTQELRNMKAVEDRDWSQGNTTRLLGFKASTEEKLAEKQWWYTHAQTRNMEVQTKALEFSLPGLANRARIAASKGGMPLAVLNSIFGGILRPFSLRR